MLICSLGKLNYFELSMIPPPGVVREIKVVYTHVIERLITAFGIFTILYLVLLLLISGSRKKTKTKKTKRCPEERSDILQFGKWRESFSSDLCFVL